MLLLYFGILMARVSFWMKNMWWYIIYSVLWRIITSDWRLKYYVYSLKKECNWQQKRASIPPPLTFLPSGGCSISPFFSHVPIGWISEESTSLQKSLLLSLPSRRRRRRTPVKPITVAIQTEVELRGSWASSFIPTLKSLEGGTLACRYWEHSLFLQSGLNKVNS